ncbi:hypothetical protein [Streptomyces sp. NPDC001781]
MTGPQHYREAERHLSAASYLREPDGLPTDPVAAAHHLGLAQVHADLAKAAATALNASVLAFAHDLGDTRVTEWDAVIAKTPKGDDLD